MTSDLRTGSRPTGVRADLLEAIVRATQHAVRYRTRERTLAELDRDAQARTPRGDAFRRALTGEGKPRVIAECKRRSPSRGVLRSEYVAADIAKSYEAGGAAAISVLTEPSFFDGRSEDLSSVRDVVTVPVLCKDFVVTEYQVTEARAIGADALLLIVAALDRATLRSLLNATRAAGLSALVEVHSGAELADALEAGADVVGVNNRNLRTLEVNLDESFALIEQVPDGVVAVAESGLQVSQDLVALGRVGFDAFLIGESLMTQPDPGRALRILLEDAGRLGWSKRVRSS